LRRSIEHRHALHVWWRWGHPHPHHRHDRLLRRETRRWWRLREGASKLSRIRRIARDGHGRSSAESHSHGGGRGSGSDWKSVVFARLGSEKALGGRSVSLALSVLLESVLDRDSLVHQKLAVHGFHCSVGGLKIGIGYEPVSF
jgi:hypothetical protein